MQSGYERDHVVAVFEVHSEEPERAIEAIAIGQSIGNPTLRSPWETEEMWERWSCKIAGSQQLDGKRVRAVLAFPEEMFTPGSLTHLLTVVMGGQVDIDLIQGCRLLELSLPPRMLQKYPGPARGIEGLRELVGCRGRPFIGGIVKPKTGIRPAELAEICRQLADGGVDFIKEDEILGDIAYCPLEARVEQVLRALEPYRVIYAPCLTAPVEELPRALAAVERLGANAYHVNFWAGLDVFRSLARQNELVSFYQKSGDRVMTTGRYAIDFSVWCQLARVAGADIIHAGMLGGYLDEGEEVMRTRCQQLRGELGGLRSTLPSLSCGATPQVVPELVAALGRDVMIASGGAIHSHPGGTRAGARAFRDAADACAEPAACAEPSRARR